MNWAICKNTWKRILANKLRMWILVVWIFKPIITTTVMLCLQHEFSDQLFSDSSESIYFVLICGSGVIGSQLNDGTLSLVLSRPVTIANFVFTKWYAISVAASVAAMVQLVCELIIALSRTPAAVNFVDVATNGIERLFVCAGFAAVMVLLSALVSGIKDLGLYLLLSIAASIFSMLSAIKPQSVPEGLAAVNITVPITRQLSTILQTILSPSIDISPMLSGLWLSLNSVTSYLAVITVCLALSIYSLNRRELPYGAD